MSGVAPYPKPWLARCVCGPVARSATHAGAVVQAEAHRARNAGHIVEVVHAPEPAPADSGRGGVLLLAAVVVLVALVAGGVLTGLRAAVADLPRQAVCTGQADQPEACEVRP